MRSDPWLEAYKLIRKSNAKEIPRCIEKVLMELCARRPDGLRSPVSTSQIRRHLEDEWNFVYIDGGDVRRACRQLVKKGLVREIKTEHPNNYGGHRWVLET